MVYQIMRDLKAMELTRILAYSQLLTEITDDMTKFGQMAYQCFEDGGIEEHQATEIHEILAREIDDIEKVRVNLAKELTRRVKHDLGVKKGPGDIDTMLNKWLQKYVYIGRTKSEIAHFKAKAEENRALMKKK